MMNRVTPEHILRGIALLCLAGVGIALVSQHVFDMQPCAWCVLQRLILLAIAAWRRRAGARRPSMPWGLR